jgi:glutathione S-transferase
MLKLCGFAASNYYNKVKIALLEKEVAFEEELVWAGAIDKNFSPLGKVPYLITNQGPISESNVILEYLEEQYPQQSLLPTDPYERAKVREVILHFELYIELVARTLFPEALFGGKVSDETKDKAKKQLDRSIISFSKMVQFDQPYLVSQQMSFADCAALVHFPLIGNVTKTIYGEDIFADLPIQKYMNRVGKRPYMSKVNADRKANAELLIARIKGSR